ncbi:hypothetical protein BURMUCF2_B0240, partial [Burkholderia multivorans CF2]
MARPLHGVPLAHAGAARRAAREAGTADAGP